MKRDAAVFSPCPLFLLIVLVVLALAQLGALLFALPSPYQSVQPPVVVLAGLCVTGVFALAAAPKTWLDWFRCLAAGMILPFGNSIMPAALAETAAFLPHVYDANVVRLDDAFGGQVSFVIGTVLVHNHALRAICGVVYATVLLPPAAVAVAEAFHARRSGIGALPTFLTIAAVGFVIYHILPVIGPLAYFGDAFPSVVHVQHAQPRNAMPSLHTAWVLMAFLTTRRMPIARIITGVWLAVMLVATLGSGEHYLTDLICAAPFVLVLRALSACDLPWRGFARWSAVLIGSLVFAVWGLAVRGVMQPASVPGLVPAFAAFTLVVAWISERRLARAQGMLAAAVGVSQAGLMPSAERCDP